MTAAAADLDTLVQNALNAIADASDGPAHADTTMRERFFELLVLILANLYTKTPVAGALFDRTMLLRITTGMDDADAGRLSGRTEDWLRLEALLRQQDGTKSYYMTRPSLSVLSSFTAAGTLGDVFDKILKRYIADMPSENLRRATRMLGSYFLTRVSRS
jgi:hypothetical protein